MTDNPERQLGDRLAALTRWRGERTQLWRKAMAATERGGTQGRILSWRWLRAPHWRIAALIAVLAGVTGTVWFLSAETAMDRYVRVNSPDTAAATPLRQEDQRLKPMDYVFGLPATEAGLSVARGGFGAGGSPAARILTDKPGELLDADRHVVRKATIELVTDDVPLAFVKCRQLISEAHGEFIESSSLTGSGATARGDLTLRVAAGRLSDVLNDLRRLARVRAEQTHGEDVTAQVIDLEARLRNERRVESELLDLLEKRTDAPLKDILEMRRQMNLVRESIERLAAQGKRMDRLVALASVLVVIRPADASDEEPETDLGSYFSGKLHASWTGGLRFLADTISGGLRVAVGGLMWWLLLAAVFVTVRHHLRTARMS